MTNRRKTQQRGNTTIYPLSVHFYLQQYQFTDTNYAKKNPTLFEQISPILDAYDTNCTNRNVMRKLNTQVAIEMEKNERSVGISFNEELEIDVWNENGEFLYSWSPEIDVVYNIYVDYMLKNPTRIYIKTNEGTSFVLDPKYIHIAYDME
tara:strand:+ start:67 stop:516 length:450 start_codon:yes stop_codon:yes gene_type:complete